MFRFRTLIDFVSGLSFVERVIFYVLVLLFAVSSIGLLLKLNNAFLVEIPTHGGHMSEGILGTPRFINPLLATSDPDRDLTEIIYAGLMKVTSEGTLVPELAEDYTISEDKLTYTFTLRDDAYFHDGTRVTAEDVVYTIELARNPDLKSPLRATWEGVTVSASDVRTVVFELSQVYRPFLENTTLGILPKHLWEITPPEHIPFSTLNLDPIGAGPYEVHTSRQTQAGIPEYYELGAFKDYVHGTPFIDEISFRFYEHESDIIDALEKGDIDGTYGLMPESVRSTFSESETHTLHTTELPRVFGVFFNQNKAPLFAETEVREALEAALQRETIVENIFGEFANPIDSPLIGSERFTQNTESPEATLEAAGWEKDEELGFYMKETKEDSLLLSFSLVTANIPELQESAELIASMWRNIGADVTLSVVDVTDLKNSVIRPREYEALFFGQVIGRGGDLFPFWHSSQRNDPGLNIALYANIETDSILEKIRTTFDDAALRDLSEQFVEEIRRDIPAIFIYTPNFIYINTQHINGIDIDSVTTPAERFASIDQWYIHTDHVWPFFAQ